MTDWRSLRKFFTQISGRWKFKARMHVFTGLAVGTESSQIIFAQNSANVTMPAPGTMSAKSSIVPRTIFYLALGIDVQKRAFFLVACVESRVEVTFGHFCHVIFMQELAAVAFFAKCSQPMLADDGFLFGFDVPKRAKLLIASS